MKKTKKISKRTKMRLVAALILFGFSISMLSYKLITYMKDINDVKNEKEALEGQIADLLENEEVLKVDIEKLKDPEYVAKYAREKYLYSKDGEYIIRIVD